MYEWIDNWVRIPDTASGRENGRTHGVCETRDGRVFIFYQAQDGLLEFAPDGQLISARGGDRWLGAHGLTLFEEEGEERLWLVDQNSCEVAKTTLEGEVLLTLPKPDHEAYVDGKYTPTWAAQNPDNGEVWVADGYGSNLVSRYSSDGSYLESIASPKGNGLNFKCPHGVNFTRGEGGAVELWITDRANSRICVCDGEGNLVRAFDTCHSPCCFDFREGSVVVPELFGSVKVLDAKTGSVQSEAGVGAVKPNPDPNAWWPPAAPEGWPNLAGTEHVRPGWLNSPHGGCFSANGDLFVVEWIIGGRVTKLVREG